MPVQLTDEQLMAGVVAGENDALETLYQRYGSVLLRVILRIVENRAEAEELVQETFVRVWERGKHFRADRGTFPNWLFTIGRNLALDRRRRQQTRPQTSYEAESVENGADEHEESDVLEKIWTTIQYQEVWAAIRALPQEQYEVILHAYFYGKTRREIARERACPLGTVHTRARLALLKLRQMLAHLMEE